MRFLRLDGEIFKGLKQVTLDKSKGQRLVESVGQPNSTRPVTTLCLSSVG